MLGREEGGVHITLNENYQGFLILVEVGIKMAPGFGA